MPARMRERARADAAEARCEELRLAEHPRAWTDVLVGAHRGVLASLEARAVPRPTGR